MSNENSKLDAERSAFETAFEGVFFSSCFEREDDGSYAGRGLQGAWLGWQKARSLPVGVPGSVRDDVNGHRWNCRAVDDYAPGECNCDAAPAAPTVKAELSTDEATELALLREYRLSGIAFNDSQGEGYTVEQSIRAEQRMEAAEKACWDFYTGRRVAPSLPVKAERWKCGKCGASTGEACNANGCFANERTVDSDYLASAFPDQFTHADAAPSLPAAGSAGEEVEVVEFHWPEYHHQGMGCGLEDRGITDRYDAMQYGWDCALERCAEIVPDEPLMTVAQHNRIVAALSAQQSAPDWVDPVALSSCGPVYDAGWRDGVAEAKRLNERVVPTSAPERVSVPRDLLADLISSDHDTRIHAERRLYALLASHGRGEA